MGLRSGPRERTARNIGRFLYSLWVLPDASGSHTHPVGVVVAHSGQKQRAHEYCDVTQMAS